MMGVYIPGMEMPKEEKISLAIFPDGRVYKYQGDLLRGYGEDCIPWRAVPVPPHGRLIDADAIPFIESENGCIDDYAYRYDINELPTIIPPDPAEEGKEW